MFDEEKQTKTNVTIYHIVEYGVICTTILVSMHGNANSGKAYLNLIRLCSKLIPIKGHVLKKRPINRARL